jgi:hypothetical protein
MAALDFGMALARGMLPKATKAQKDLMDLAGGRNVFKSEDWWNQAVDKQISEGYRTVERQDKEFLMPSGEYQPGQRQVSTTYGRSASIGGISWWSPVNYTPSYSPIFGYGGGLQARTSVSYKAPEGAVFTIDPRTREKQYTSRDFDVFGKREDYTAGELSDIEAGAKAGASRAKRQTEQAKSAQRRLRKGTGGLLAKAATPEDTGLPSLGKGGLGLTTSILGSETKL